MITEEYVQSLSKLGKRMDGRKFDEYRNLSIEYGISAKSAEGSARVKIGGTEVVAGVKLDLGTPYSDRPAEGTIMVNVELLPLSSTKYESGPPDVSAIEMSRVIDRGIRECDAVDFKKLCVTPGEKVWMVFVDIYPLNNDGNLIDAASLAATAALKSAVFPKLNGDKIVYGDFTKTKIPLNLMPVTCTVVNIGGKSMVDPILEEEKNFDARISVSVSEKGDIHAMQKGGNVGLEIDQVDEMIGLTVKKSAEIRKVLK